MVHASSTSPPSLGKRAWAVPLADFVGSCITPAVAKQGFAAADIVLHWPEIVGSRLARVCEPIRLQRPPRARGASLEGKHPGATLVVRVEGPFAIELQHLADVVIERANARLGWRCIEKVALRQSPPMREGRRCRKRLAVAPDAAARAAELVHGVESEALRAALTRLGANVLSDNLG